MIRNASNATGECDSKFEHRQTLYIYNVVGNKQQGTPQHFFAPRSRRNATRARLLGLLLFPPPFRRLEIYDLN